MLELAIRPASNCHAGHLKAKPEMRRLFNQAFFEAIYIKDQKIERARAPGLFRCPLLREGPHSM